MAIITPLYREAEMVLLRNYWQNRPARKECCVADRFHELEDYATKNMEDLSMGLRDLKRQMEAQHSVLISTLAETIKEIRALKEGK